MAGNPHRHRARGQSVRILTAPDNGSNDFARVALVTAFKRKKVVLLNGERAMRVVRQQPVVLALADNVTG
jgi:hypothetical protein